MDNGDPTEEEQYLKARLVAHELDRVAEAESLQPSKTWSALVITAGRSMSGNGPTAAQVRAQNRQARRAVAALGSALQLGPAGAVSH